LKSIVLAFHSSECFETLNVVRSKHEFLGRVALLATSDTNGRRT